MGQPAARRGDRVIAIDMHSIQPPGTTPPVMTPHPFSGIIDGGVSANVKIGGMAAATKDSTATNTPPHLPIGGSFVNPPNNKATITSGSASVTINGKAAARAGDPASTCTEAPAPLPGKVVAVGVVTIGG
jgi:uncharacterized Zn-binding protein involved in type VI secretion